jgi:hypothetical protein
MQDRIDTAGAEHSLYDEGFLYADGSPRQSSSGRFDRPDDLTAAGRTYPNRNRPKANCRTERQQCYCQGRKAEECRGANEETPLLCV